MTGAKINAGFLGNKLHRSSPTCGAVRLLSGVLLAAVAMMAMPSPAQTGDVGGADAGSLQAGGPAPGPSTGRSNDPANSINAYHRGGK